MIAERQLELVTGGRRDPLQCTNRQPHVRIRERLTTLARPGQEKVIAHEVHESKAHVQVSVDLVRLSPQASLAVAVEGLLHDPCPTRRATRIWLGPQDVEASARDRHGASCGDRTEPSGAEPRLL